MYSAANVDILLWASLHCNYCTPSYYHASFYQIGRIYEERQKELVANSC